jgi:hypothetical protein
VSARARGSLQAPGVDRHVREAAHVQRLALLVEQAHANRAGLGHPQLDPGGRPLGFQRLLDRQLGRVTEPHAELVSVMAFEQRIERRHERVGAAVRLHARARLVHQSAFGGQPRAQRDRRAGHRLARCIEHAHLEPARRPHVQERRLLAGGAPLGLAMQAVRADQHVQDSARPRQVQLAPRIAALDLTQALEARQRIGIHEGRALDVQARQRPGVVGPHRQIRHRRERVAVQHAHAQPARAPRGRRRARRLGLGQHTLAILGRRGRRVLAFGAERVRCAGLGRSSGRGGAPFARRRARATEPPALQRPPGQTAQAGDQRRREEAQPVIRAQVRAAHA